MDEPGPVEGGEEAGAGGGAPVRIEISGLSLFTRHGVSKAERELGQRLVVDVVLELDDCGAVATDRIADTIDYEEVCQEVALAAQGRSYSTLERLCGAVGDRLIERYGADSATVRAAKPEPPMPLPVEEVAVELTRERG